MLDLKEVIEDIVSLQRRRRFLIQSQQRIDRSCESYLVRMFPEHDQIYAEHRQPGGKLDKAGRDKLKKLFKQVSAFRKKVESGKDHPTLGSQARNVLADSIPLIVKSVLAREAFDTLREETEERMRELAKFLPAYRWAQTVSGFGDLCLAVIVGEAGDLSAYPNKDRRARSGPACLWKRCGLAVIGEERQRKKSDADEAARHGYSPRRRGTIYGDIQTPLFFAKAKNAYGAVYAARRARTAETHPEWSKKHSDNDARRYIVKRLLKDLWRAWRDEASLPMRESAMHPLPLPPTHSVPDASVSEAGRRSTVAMPLQATTNVTAAEIPAPKKARKRSGARATHRMRESADFGVPVAPEPIAGS